MLSFTRRIPYGVRNIASRYASGKVVKFGVEGRALILQGVDLLADAVQVMDDFTFLFMVILK